MISQINTKLLLPRIEGSGINKCIMFLHKTVLCLFCLRASMNKSKASTYGHGKYNMLVMHSEFLKSDHDA